MHLYLGFWAKADQPESCVCHWPSLRNLEDRDGPMNHQRCGFQNMAGLPSYAVLVCCVCSRVFANSHTHTNVGIWRPDVDGCQASSSLVFPMLFLRQGLSLNLELPRSVRLTGQSIRGYPNLSHQCGDCGCASCT